MEDEEDGSVHAKDSVTVRGRLSFMKKKGSVYLPHTPNIPGRKSEVWWVSLADQKLLCPIDVKRRLPKYAKGHNPEGKKLSTSGDICCGKVSSCSAELVTSDASDLPDDPRVTVYDLKFQFTAPKPGTYNLELSAAVDCYIRCNKSRSVKLVFQEPKAIDSTGQPRYFDTDDESDYAWTWRLIRIAVMRGKRQKQTRRMMSMVFSVCVCVRVRESRARRS